MPDKKYLIEIPDMPDGSGVWDAEKWERNKDAFMADYPDAQVFELGEYDEADSRESDQILLSFEDEASSGIWDQAKWERNKYAFTKDNPEAQVSRVRYVDYWGQKAEANRAEKAALQQPDEARNARLAELGYYDDLSKGQKIFDVNAPSMIGLKPLSSAIDTNSVSGHTTYLDPRVQEFFANDSAYTDKMAEIARLDAEYDENPAVIAQREWEAQMLAEQKAYADNLEKEIKGNLESDVDMRKAARGGTAKRGYDPLESQQMSYLLDQIAGEEAGSGEHENEKLERYTTSLKLLEKAKIARDLTGKGFGGAVIDWGKEGLMDAGTQDDVEAYNEIGNILTRLEKEVGNLKEENLTEDVFDKYLSKDEQALIKSFFEYNKAMADAQQDMSRAYKGGKIFAESIPFMLEFLATGGIYKGAGRAATKGLERALVKWVSKSARNTASRTARKIAAATARDLSYALVGTTARTLVSPGTYERMAEASVEIEDGHLNRAKNAAIAAADMYVENLSEISGGLIGKTLGWAGKGVGKLIAKTPLSKVGGMLADNQLMQSISAFMPKLEALGFHGLPEEIGEEFIGNAIREVLNIQPGALKEMVSDDNFGAMLIGFAPMTLIGAAGGAISLGAINYEAAKLGNKMREMMSDHYSAEEMDAMMSIVQNAGTAEEIQQAIKPMALAIANAAERGMLTQEQAAEEIEMLYQWGGFMAQNNALLFSKRAQDNELANAKRAEMADRYGRFWQEDETESVQVATLNNGSTVFVTSAPAEDGKITTIDVATGKKGFANVSDIATQEVEGEQIQSSNKMTMDAFLNGQIAMGRKTAEETRMTNERNAQIDTLRAQITPGTRINLGTEGSLVIVYAKGTNTNGVVIVDETGMESTLGWEQAAYALGQPINVETDQQKLDAEISERLQRLSERRMRRAVTPATEATAEAADEATEAVAQEQQNIPLNEDGTVNEALFWTQDPEGYVKWNDEQNRDGGQDSLKQIAISKQELFGMLNEAATGQNTSNPTMRKAAERQVAAIAEKIARLEALEMSYADALAEEKEAVKQTQTTPTATMSEEQLEQMDTQYQGILGKTRIQSERVRVMQEYLDKLAENSAPIKVLTKDNYEEVMRAEGCPEDDIKRVGIAIKTSAITGAMIAGFASNGVTFVMADTISDVNSARITYIHERQHLLNSQNPEVVKQFAEALGDRENALRILETFVGKNGLEEYKNDPIEKLADEIICRSMEIVYSTENYSVDLQNKGLPEEAINIINTIDNGQRTDKSLASARRFSHASLSQRENAEEDGRNIEQISGGILDGEENGSLGSSSRGDGVGGQGSTGEGSEVTPEGPSFRITPEVDADYRQAIEDGDEEIAQQMVNAAAEEWAKDSKVRDEYGNLAVQYHGSRDFGFTVFNTDPKTQNLGSHFGTEEAAKVFDDKGDRTYRVYLNITNPWVPRYEDFWTNEDQVYAAAVADLAKELADKGNPEAAEMYDEIVAEYPMAENDDTLMEWFNQADRGDTYTGAETLHPKLRRLLEIGGYDGVRYNNWVEDPGNDSWVALYPEQIKSSEAATFDDDNKLIPLSERFTDNVDLRFRTAATNPEVNLTDETREELSNKGLVMDGGAIMSEGYASLKHTLGYETPLERNTDLDQVRFSIGTKDPHIANYRKHPDFEERVVEILERLAERMTMNELVYGVVSTATKHTYGKKLPGSVAGPLRSNEEYIITFDLDTSCPRTFQYLNLVKRIEKRIGRPLTQVESIQLIEIMRMYGQQIPCVYCYAENKRQALKQYYTDFIEARHGVLSAATDEEALQYMYGHTKEQSNDPKVALTEAAYNVFVEWRKNPKGMYNPTIKMLWSQYTNDRNSILTLLDTMLADKGISVEASDAKIAASVAAEFGVTNAKAKRVIEEIVAEWKWDVIEGKEHDQYTPVDEDDWGVNERALEVWRDMTSYAKSASSAKSVIRYTPYTDELKQISQKDKDYINGMGGVRMHSSNDFRIDYVFDYFQFMADMALYKMFGHTYTKSPEFVRIFGNSGYKINMSIAAYQDENGVIRPNADEGFDWEEAKSLRQLFPNAGTMLMATSDEQIQMALDSDWIDMCIPFHHSGLPKAVWYNMRMWQDYTTIQKELFMNSSEMKAALVADGVIIPKKAKADEIANLYNEHFGVKVIYDKKGKRIRPHFLPGPTVVDGHTIPGHNNDHQRYLDLCKEYGVKPRFAGMQVRDNSPEGGGRVIDVTEHPRYMIFIKETSRTDSPQTPIQFNFDQPSEALGGKTPIDYAFEELEARAMAESGLEGKNVKDIYNSLKKDQFGIAEQFINTVIKHKQETGEDYPLDYLTPESRDWFLVQRKALEEAFKDVETIPYHRNEYDEQGNLISGEGLERPENTDVRLRVSEGPIDLVEEARKTVENTSDIRFSIIGEVGAIRDKSDEGLARLNNLEVARKMEAELKPDWSAKENEDALKIKVATGWERGADGKWRYEVDDVTIKPAKDWLLSKKKLTLRDIVEPNPVFDIYPELLDIAVVKDKSKYNLGAWYAESTKKMKLPVGALKDDYTAMMDYYGAEQRDGNFARYWKIMEEDFLHEIQHAIQHIEGFAKGGTPDMLLPQDMEAYSKLYDEMSDLIDEYNAIPVRERNMAYAVSTRNKAQRAKDDVTSFLRRHKIGNEGYRRLAGEVESNNVVKRSKISDYERYNSLLASTEDVSRKDQIILMNAVESAESSIRMRVTPEQDKAYMDAVEAGDMETAQRMVDEAAKLAMPNTKVVDENGNPKVVYHGTGSEFYTFRDTSDSNELGAGYYFSDSYEMAERYATDETLADNRFRAEALAFEIFTDEMGHSEEDYDDNEFIDDYNKSYDLAVERLFGNGHVKSVFLNLENPRILSRVSPDFDPTYRYGFNHYNEGVLAKRFNDGVIDEMFSERHEGLTGNQYVAFTPSQIKSADPVTYDDAGKVIPLSERFNPESADIRFRTTRTEEQREQLFDKAKAHYGLANNFNASGYMLPDGSLLDFSEANDGGDPNRRSLDHRDIEGLIMDEGKEYDSRYKYVIDFVGEGAIRMLPEYAGFQLSVPPTAEQKSKLMDYIYKHNGEVIMEITDENGSPRVYMEYNKRTSPSRIFRDMDGYFNEGIVPGIPPLRFRVSNENQAIFVSNAAKAVEGIKQEKATPEQWLKMIEKNGGLKAGEDKWMGLSDWLKASNKKTLTKQEVLDFINENMIVIEETHYTADAESDAENTYAMIERILQEKFGNYIAEYYEQNNGEDDGLYGGDSYEYAMDKLREEMNDEFPYTIERSHSVVYLTFPYEETDDLQEWADKLGLKFAPQNPINDIRLGYTTDGLANKHEIALTIPTIEPWNVTDDTHFGDAGNGRAVAWIRFGETKTYAETEEGEEYKTFVINMLRRYHIDEEVKLNRFGTIVVPQELLDALTNEQFNELQRLKVASMEASDKTEQKVLVIDEIQSKRHQEGRDKGYADIRDRRIVDAAFQVYIAKEKEAEDYKESLDDKYGIPTTLKSPNATKEEIKRLKQLRAEARALREKWRDAQDNAKNLYGIPDAPFDKNWHELAMKRMLRYAAENGYDFIAWTKGEQQVERYSLAHRIQRIHAYRPSQSENRVISLYYRHEYDDFMQLIVNPEGLIVGGYAQGNQLADVVGKEIALKIMESEEISLQGDGLRVGGEGMRGFYDKMLPAFMNKYGKKWGIKVEDIELPNLENGLTMHSVPVTDEMKASVMEGQVMFRVRREDETPMEFTQQVINDCTSRYNEVAEVKVFPANEETAERFGFTMEEMQETGGTYLKDEDIIAIFALQDIKDSRIFENIFFHESIHKLAEFYPEFKKIGEWMWNNADVVGLQKIKNNVKKAYEQEWHHEEMLTYGIANAMSLGRVEQIESGIPEEYKGGFRQILNEIGYEPEKESRRDEGRVSESLRRGTAAMERKTDESGRSKKEEARTGELTAEERRIIGEYFPEFNKSEDVRMRVDSQGQELTEGQKEFFANSKAVDKDGNLLVLYHGTPRAGFTEFKSGWFTTSKEDAISYSGDRKGRLFDPNEKYEPETLTAGDFRLGYMTFDSEEDRAAFLGRFPYADEVMSEREYEDARIGAEDEEYDALTARRKEFAEVWNAYREYERERFVDTPIADLIANPEAYTEEDLMRAILEYDSNATFDSLDDMSAEERKDALVSALQNANEETEGGILDMVIPTRVPRNGEGIKHNDLGNRTYEVYANVENPYEIDANGRGSEFESGDIYKAVEEALTDDQYDGVIVRNWRVGRTQQLGDVVVPKNGSQVKLTSNESPMESEDVRFKVVTDPAKIEELEEGSKVEAYRAVQIDKNGKIFSPMASRLKSTKKGTKQVANEAAQMNQWDEAVESLDKVDEDGKITILDEDGGTTKVAYNPYGHCCVNSMMNDQFKRAWERDGLYVMKVLAPESELTAGYHAEKAKDAVGIHKWKTGAVGNKLPENKRREILLTRWMKNVQVMPWDAVAQDWIKTLEGENIDVPFNVVPRKILNMLAEAGVKIVAPEKGMENATKAYEQWLADPKGYVGDTELPDHVKALNEETDDDGPDNEPRFRVTGTPTEEVVANGLQLTPSQTAEVAANIFAALPEESRKKLTAGLNGNILGLKDAILQIPTSLATKENWNEEDKQMAAVVREVVQDLVDANPTTRPLTTKEALWMLYDSTNEVKDLVDAASRAFVAHNLGFDQASMQLKKEVDDYVRFRTASLGVIDAATDMYNYETSLWTERLKESWIDMNQSVKSLQEALAKSSGMAIEPWENIVFALNQLSSKSYADKKKYMRDFLVPLWDAVMEIVKVDGKSIEEIERYMMLKHGLERNKKFAARDAKEFYRAMYDLVAERMKSQSHAQQVVALSEAKKALADIDAKIAVASSSQLPRLNEARARALYDVQVADLVLRGDEKLNEQELQDYYDNIDNELDHKYWEFREKDYGGLTSMFVDTTPVQRSNYKSEEAYQKAVLAATKPRFDKVADMEAEAQAEVDYFEKVVGAQNLWDKVNAATKETLRHQYEAGMITIEQYEAVRDMFKYYVPLRGFADNTAVDMYSYYMDNSASGFAQPILGAKGRKTRSESPLGWIGTMAESAIQADNKNEAKMTLYYATLRRPDQNLLSITETWYEYTGQRDANNKKIFAPAYPPATDRALNADELRQHMEDWEDDMRKKQSRGEAYKGSQKVDLKGSVVFQDSKEEKEHIIRVKVAGKDYSILINGNPRAAQAINGLLNPDADVSPIGEWVGKLRRGMSSLLTSFSPLFWVANYQRDLLSSFMRTSESEGWGEAFKYLANRRKAWRVASYVYKYENGTLGNSYYENLYKEFAENGGITGYTVLTTNKEYEQMFADYAKNVDRKVLNAVKGAFDKFMQFGEAIEQVSRFAAYITARESGKSIEEAVSAAKEVSVNFNRKGSAKPISLDELDKLRTKDGKKLNAVQKGAVIVLSAMPKGMKELYFFFNASVQALSSSAKLAKKSPGKAVTWAGLYFGTSIAMAMLNYLLSGDDDDEYLDLPDYLRHSTLLIKVSDDYYFKWSLPQEMRPFYAWADLLVSKAMGKMPHKNLGKEMALVAAQWLPVNPFEAEDPLLGLIPDYGSPIAEAWMNKTSFGGRIYDDMKFKSEAQREDIPAYRKATEKTGKVYVDLAELLNDISGGDEVVKGGININPAVVEHLVEGYGGGIYDFAKMMIALPSMLISDDPVEIKKIPFVNKVIMSVDETNMYSHVNDAFWHYSGIADNAKRVEKEYRESDDPSRADDYQKEEDWRIYLLYKQYESDFKNVKEKLDNAVDKEEEDLLKQEQNVLREMFLNDIAKGDIPEITFQIREDVKRFDKEIKTIMKPVSDANKERLERQKAGDVDGMLEAIERRESLKDTPEYKRAEELNKDLKKIKQQLEELGSVTRGAQRDSVIGEVQKNYDALIQKMEQL